ncbi:TIGR04255 family protein [Pseudomonas mosselii]|uniref:TIGR04255 family protein n=1 Tax=Pseudomonas mosselii TaxID=78327 RepID=UPI001646C5EB|nr:TIGR04255 family protein [Pseudomonas mosselii]MBC3450859.1 TIGR04255 family protein [Pseudomonas mosselii]
MNEQFDNPPLVELVAELRWKDLSTPAPPPGFPVGFPFGGNQQMFDVQLAEMTAAMTAIGYGQSERLIPQGFPAPAEAPIVRFRYSGSAERDRDHLPSTLFQLGSGIFTINAVKPYKSWNDFKPVVEHGVRILLQTQKVNVEGYSLILRYIDAFRKDLTGDLSHLQFLKEVFGFGVDVPPVLLKHADQRTVNLLAAQVVVPLSFGSLQLQMAEGEIDGGPAYILENVVSIDGLVGADVGVILESLSKARDVIHDVFMSLSAPLQEKMAPVEGKG